MTSLVLKAYQQLLLFDVYLKRGNLAALLDRVERCSVSQNNAGQHAVRKVCSAVDIASVCYWKQVLCLQRSAATVCLLRRLGVQGQLVIGVQQLPFKAHAWVEVGDQVVNDKPYVRQIYAALKRC